MTLRQSVIFILAAAFLTCSGVTVKAQAPTDTPPRTDQTDTRRDIDADWGWLGLLGLLGLGGLAGRRDAVIGTRRTPDRM